MAKQKRSTDVPEGRAMQMGDFDATGQRIIKGKMKQAGRAKDALAGRIEQLDAAAAASDSDSARKAGRQANNLRELQPHVKNVNVTLQTAVDRRVGHFVAGIQRSAEEGVASGSGWYFDHHADIAASAAEHGFPTRQAITGSAVMSPLNSPDNEKAAIDATMRHVNGERGEDVDRGLRRSGLDRNGRRAMAHMSADNPSNPIKPLTEPKVHSYEAAIQNAVPGSDVHREYSDRMHHITRTLTGHEMMGQTRLDLNGMADSTEGILNPRGNTAEDSWMHSITMGQDFATSVGRGGRTNLGKTIGSDKMTMEIGKKDEQGVSAHPSGAVKPSTMVHAFNNDATIRAAERIGLATGSVDSSGNSNMPSVGMQEVAWTEARRVAGKDPEYTPRSRTASTSQGSAAQSISRAQIEGQQSLEF